MIAFNWAKRIKNFSVYCQLVNRTDEPFLVRPIKVGKNFSFAKETTIKVRKKQSQKSALERYLANFLSFPIAILKLRVYFNKAQYS